MSPGGVREFVLGGLVTLWGYEADPVVMAELLSRLRSTRINQLIDDHP